MKKLIYRILESIELAKRHFVNPEKYVPNLFNERMGYVPDLDKPLTFNEKLCWMKLYYHNPICTKLVDKYEVREYVANKIGTHYLIPLLGVWDNVEDIEWDKLPEKYVLKCSHDSGSVIICKDKEHFNKRQAGNRLRHCLKKNYYYDGFEWPYKDVKPRVIAEAYMENADTRDLRDYKFFCFDGEIKALFIATDRQKYGEDVKFDFFDPDFNHLPFRQGHENASIMPDKPICFDEMKKLAAVLSEGFPQCRVDFYEVDGKVYFGEITFFHHGGWTRFDPMEWDYTFGDWIKLPEKMI